MTVPTVDKPVQHILALSGGKDSSALRLHRPKEDAVQILLFGGRGVKRDMWEQANGAKLKPERDTNGTRQEQDQMTMLPEETASIKEDVTPFRSVQKAACSPATGGPFPEPPLTCATLTTCLLP